MYAYRHSHASLGAVMALVLAVVVAACGGTEDEQGSGGREGAKGGKPVNLGAPLPRKLAKAGKLVAGVRCDYPPTGYIDIKGKNVGFEIDLVRRLAEFAFGDPSAVDLVCVQDATRVPYLTGGKVDLVMATMAITPERDKEIDFSKPYWVSYMQILARRDAPVQDYEDLQGQRVIQIKGSTYVDWFRRCVPEAELLLVATPADAITALKQARGVAFPYVEFFVTNIAAKQKDDVRTTGPLVSPNVQGIGYPEGDEEFGRWLDAAVEKMRGSDFIWQAFTRATDNQQLVRQFADLAPRPGQPIEVGEKERGSCSS